MRILIKLKNSIIIQNFQIIKNWLLNIRIATVVIASGCILCMSFFMNCSSTDSPISKSSTNSTPTTQGNSGGGGGTTVSTTTTFYTNPNPGETPVVGGSSSNIVWLHTDVSSWEKTSEITKVEIKENGEVCIEHSKSGQWEAKSIADPNSNTDPSSSDSVEGNAWILVPIRDAFYAGIYDYVRAGEACHTLNAGSIANLYNSDKSLGRRVDKNPLKKLGC